MLPHFIFALSPLLSLLPFVAAHGYLTQVSIDGTSYSGNVPAAAQPSDSPIRQISDISPVKGADNPSLNCGLNAELATMVVPANPGSVMEFYWGDLGGGNWPHIAGPLMTYMALCDTSTCDKFNGSTAKWFKIDQIGQKSDGTWYQQAVSNRQPISVTLPEKVAPGEYLVRNEIIALQLAVSLGGAEFYPSCTQIRVGGSQTGTPNQTVLFPGAYSDNDPGIYDPNVYTPGAAYIFPGPPVSNLASPADMTGEAPANSSSSGSGNSSPSPTGTNAKPTSTSGSGAQSSLNRVCKLQKHNALLSRRGTDITQHKRRTNFMRAVLDVFHYS